MSNEQFRRAVDPRQFQVTDADREFFENQLGGFVPPDAFDAHAHWYDLRHILDDKIDPVGARVAYDALSSAMSRWMGTSVVRDGLYFPFPIARLDCAAANEFLATELADRPGSRGLMVIRPDDDPDNVAATLTRHGFAGFKVYHVFSARQPTFDAEPSEFLPDWAWELADQSGLCIMLHIVRKRALSDPLNTAYIRDRCRRYPGAKLILAHAARGFNAAHTTDAIDELRGIDNVFFDTSAICEAAPLEAILRATGTTRLMYGSDFPVSEMRGRAISLGDGFYWLDEQTTDWSRSQHGQPTLVGIESLLAMKQACRTLCLNDSDIERIFGGNARQLLGIGPAPDGQIVQEQYHTARRIIPGGTQLLSKRPELFAPGHWPAYYEQAIGCEVIDTSGRRFVDMSFSGILACILGFADPDVNAAVIRRVHLGSMATQQTHDEVRLAELLLEIHPWADMARFVRSGGEAMAVAVRIARAATGRDKVAVCGYHGWHDWYLAANLGPEGTATLDGHLLPGLEPAGVPRGLRGTTLTFNYNRLDQIDALIAEHGDELAAIVMEPTRHVDPEPGFLEGVRERARSCGAKLVFDEISIGWRLCLGGAHLKFGVAPDIAVFAKTISNGFAMAAVIGNGDTMSAAQSTFISSAYWTEGIGPAAALATVRKLRQLDVPAHLAAMGTQMMTGWMETGRRHGLPVTAGGRPELVKLGFNHADADALMTLFTTRMLDHGFLACGAFNPTWAHQERHVDEYLATADVVFAELVEAIDKGDALQRIGGRVKHNTFARLTD